jgi:hypothetical protein
VLETEGHSPRDPRVDTVPAARELRVRKLIKASIAETR